jgi:predicted porin
MGSSVLRKTTLGLGVCTLCGAAAAQSSVTAFGVVDLFVGMIRNDETTTQLGEGGMSSSRIGFRGTEDLGGGLKAGFWLEAAIGPDTGRGGASFGNGAIGANNSDPNFLFFGRRSTVSLWNPWGELRLGRDYTATYWNWSVFDPFGQVGIGRSGNLGIGFTGLNALAPGGSYGTSVRANNMVGYFLPNGGSGPGLYGQIQASAGEGAAGNKFVGGRIGYASGPYNVAAAYGQTDVTVSGSVTLENWNIGGSWNFGVLKLSGNYSSMTLDGAAREADQDNWFVGVAAPWGQWNFKASYAQVRRGGALSGQKANQWAVGGDYNLSKRTALYATYAAIDNTDSNFTVLANASTLSVGNNSSGGQVGIRHSF